MVIVGTYPDLDGASGSCNSLQQLRQVVESVLPPGIIVHLLPPYPSAGDGGFAANDWFSVRDELGSWQDITNWASNRKIILDGIYNHVGAEHLWVKQFFAGPSIDGPLYAYRCPAPPSEQLSPRGGSVFRKYEIEGDTWHLWQTFSRASFDIRLSLPIVKREIDRHLQFLVASNLFGVRLDGCAYYGHSFDEEQFHNPEGKRFAQWIAQRSNELGLFVLAQLDIDPLGASYFPKNGASSIPAVDYAYSALLVLALLTESATEMVAHVERCLRVPCSYIRPPRTHDGILLKSDMLNEVDCQKLTMLARKLELSVRIVEEEDYEINASLPYICSIGLDDDMAWQRILLVIGLTGMLPGIPYFYLPFILGDQPEKRCQESADDPRSLNRARLRLEEVDLFLRSERREALFTLLHSMDSTLEEFPGRDFSISALSDGEHTPGLLVGRDENRCCFACNFSTKQSVDVPVNGDMTLAWGNRVYERKLGPLGFGVWVNGASNR